MYIFKIIYTLKFNGVERLLILKILICQLIILLFSILIDRCALAHLYSCYLLGFVVLKISKFYIIIYFLNINCAFLCFLFFFILDFNIFISLLRKYIMNNIEYFFILILFLHAHFVSLILIKAFSFKIGFPFFCYTSINNFYFILL